MFPNVSGSTQSYLANLARTQRQMQQVQAEITSGNAVTQASDNPGAISEILQLQAQLTQNNQVQTNLSLAATELSTADAALQQAVSVLDSAISLGAQGATSTCTAEQRQAISLQVQSLQKQLLATANTTVDGRYIFSGDQDTQPAYQLDATNTATGVSQVATGGATRVIVDASGTSIAVARTAQAIFDDRDSNGLPTANNVFAAVQSLITSLNNNDQAGIGAAATVLKTASTFLNGQLTFYGTAENQVTNATALAQKFQTLETQQLSGLQDADVASLAVALKQEQVQNEAALSVESTLLQSKNLFNYVA